MPKSTLSNPRGVRGAASLCAVAALAYLFVQDLLTIFVSALMGMRVQGASLSDPVGFSVAAQGLLGIVVALLRMSRVKLLKVLAGLLPGTAVQALLSLAPGLAAAVLLLRHAREPARLRPAIVLTLVCAIAHGLLLAGAFLQVLMLR